MKKLALLALAAGTLLSGCAVYSSAPHHDGYGYGYGYRHDGYRHDRDRDGIANRHDRDRDGDGVPNRHDRRPNNPRRY